MANKLHAVFLLCTVVAAATYVPAVATLTDNDHFKSCFNACHNECTSGGSGNTFCEMKCDADCGYKEAAAKLNFNLHA